MASEVMKNMETRDVSKKRKAITYRSTDIEGHPHHTDTGGPGVETGAEYRHTIMDAGDMRDHEIRSLPSPQGGDMWGAQKNAPMPVNSQGNKPIYACA